MAQPTKHAAHWSTVTREIARKTGTTWGEAKRLYQDLKAAREGRSPSLYAVRRYLHPTGVITGGKTVKPTAAPPPPPPVSVAPKGRGRRGGPELVKAPPAVPKGTPPLLVKAPPGKPRPKAETVPKRQAARNDWERELLANGLPVVKIRKTPVSDFMKEQGRKEQKRVAELLGRGIRQIRKTGGMKPKTRDQVFDFFKKMADNLGRGYFQQILRQLYKGAK